MSTQTNTKRDRTTVEIDGDTHRALNKLNDSDERYGDTIREALRRLKDAEPERLEVEL